MHEITRKKREAWWSIVGHSDVKKATKDATNSDVWGPTVAQLKGVTAACYVTEDRAEVMHNLWKRIEEREPKKWMKVAKTLTVLEYVCLHGPEDVVQEVRSGAYRMKDLKKFEYFDEKGDDKGDAVRAKAAHLLDLVKDDRKFKESRERAKRTSERIVSASTTNVQHVATPPTSTKIEASPDDTLGAHYVRDATAASPPVQMKPKGDETDEQIARRLQKQFDEEARAAGASRSAPAEAAPAPAAQASTITVDGMELAGVDLEQQKKMLEEFRSKAAVQPITPVTPAEAAAAAPAPAAPAPPAAAAMPVAASASSPAFDPRASEAPAPAAPAADNDNLLSFSPLRPDNGSSLTDDLFGAPTRPAPAPPQQPQPPAQTIDDIFGTVTPAANPQAAQTFAPVGGTAPRSASPSGAYAQTQRPPADDFEALMMSEFSTFSHTGPQRGAAAPTLTTGQLGAMARKSSSPTRTAPMSQGPPVPFAHVQQTVPMPQPTNRQGYYSSPPRA